MGDTFCILVLVKNEQGDTWLVTASAATPEPLMALPSHHDQIVMRLDKAHYPGVALAQREILNAHTGAMEAATIWQVAHV